MEVKDAAGATIGRVAYVEIGDPGAVAPEGFDNLPGEETAKSLERTRSRTCHPSWSHGSC